MIPLEGTSHKSESGILLERNFKLIMEQTEK